MQEVWVNSAEDLIALFDNEEGESVADWAAFHSGGQIEINFVDEGRQIRLTCSSPHSNSSMSLSFPLSLHQLWTYLEELGDLSIRASGRCEATICDCRSRQDLKPRQTGYWLIDGVPPDDEDLVLFQLEGEATLNNGSWQSRRELAAVYCALAYRDLTGIWFHRQSVAAKLKRALELLGEATP